MMGMSPTLIGFLGGLVLGLIPYFTLGSVISRGERETGDTSRFALLDLVRKFDLLLLPLVGAGLGYFGFLDGVLS
jgi:hypothetical protein